MKKNHILSLLITLSMIFCLAVPGMVWATDSNIIPPILKEGDGSILSSTPLPFNDLGNVSDEGKFAICTTNYLGIAYGLGTGDFAAKEKLPREQFVTAAYRLDRGESQEEALVSSKAYKGLMQVKDISGRWSEGYIGYYISNGALTGDENENFNPEEPIKGYDAAIVLMGIVGYKDKQVNGFIGNNYAANAISKAQSIGLTEGVNLNEDLTREGMAVLFNNTLNIAMVEQQVEVKDGKHILMRETSKNKTVGQVIYGSERMDAAFGYAAAAVFSNGENLGLQRADGIVTAIPGLSLFGPKAEDGKIVVCKNKNNSSDFSKLSNNYEFMIFPVSADYQMLGRMVTVYYKEATVTSPIKVYGSPIENTNTDINKWMGSLEELTISGSSLVFPGRLQSQNSDLANKVTLYVNGTKKGTFTSKDYDKLQAYLNFPNGLGKFRLVPTTDDKEIILLIDQFYLTGIDSFVTDSMTFSTGEKLDSEGINLIMQEDLLYEEGSLKAKNMVLLKNLTPFTTPEIIKLKGFTVKGSEITVNEDGTFQIPTNEYGKPLSLPYSYITEEQFKNINKMSDLSIIPFSTGLTANMEFTFYVSPWEPQKVLGAVQTKTKSTNGNVKESLEEEDVVEEEVEII